MNATLKQNTIACWEQRLHTTLNREETLEMIVPDACADILDIICTQAQVELRTRECGSGTLELAGQIPCTILYEPEGEGGIQRLSAQLPLRFTAEVEAVTPQSRCLITPRVSLAETRAINPRKVLIRVTVALELRLYEPAQLSWATEIEDREELGIQVRRQKYNVCYVGCIAQRPFSCSERLQLPGSRAAMEELIRVDCRAFDSEARLVGEKLIFKGGVMAHLLYRSTEGELTTAELELPFSQIAEVGETGEGASFQLEVQVSAVEARQTEPEGRGVELELELLAQVVVREKREIELLCDAYCIHACAEPEFVPCLLPQLLEQGSRRESLREVLDTPQPPAQVCELSVQPGQVRLVSGALCTQLHLEVLYRTEEGRYACAERDVQVSCPVEVAEGSECLAGCTVTEADAVTAPGGVEVRVGVEFQLLVRRQQRIGTLAAFQMENNEAEEQGLQPSIVLRRMEKGESLWDIAKAYRTTVEEIQKANGGESLGGESMLLIPRTR